MFVEIAWPSGMGYGCTQTTWLDLVFVSSHLFDFFNSSAVVMRDRCFTDSRILNINRGSLHSRGFRRIHLFILRYWWTKIVLTGLKSFRTFEKRASGLSWYLINLCRICRFHIFVSLGLTPRPHYEGEIWKHNFTSTVTPSFHTNLPRKERSSTGGVWRHLLRGLVRRENTLKTELFQNDDVTIYHVISLPQFFSNTNLKWPMTVAFSNFCSLV